MKNDYDTPRVTEGMVIDGYTLDKFGRTVGYIRRYVGTRFYGFISNVPEAVELDAEHPSDVFFLAEFCSSSMKIHRGRLVSFRLVQVPGNGGLRKRALDIIPLEESPELVLTNSRYRALVRAPVVATQIEPEGDDMI